MASSSPYLVLIAAFSFICFVLSCSATFLPVWGYFEEGGGLGFSSHGYYSPWTTCKELTYNREKCGSEGVSRFRPSGFVYVSGIMIVISTLALGLFCVLSVVQIIAISQHKKSFTNGRKLVTLKMILAGAAAITTLLSAGMFAIQTDDLRRGFEVSFGYTFYLVIVNVFLTILLAVMSFYDLTLSKTSENDPISSVDARRSRATFI